MRTASRSFRRAELPCSQPAAAVTRSPGSPEHCWRKCRIRSRQQRVLRGSTGAPARSRARAGRSLSDSISLGPGREFDVIRDLVRRWGSAAQGIGDDAAVLDVPAGSRLVASTDATVENVHFRRGWLSPSDVGYRAATAALSDLAAMAATPIAMLVAMCVPARWRSSVGEIAEGIGRASRAFEAPI